MTPNVNEILKLKENFLNISNKKIKNIYKMINDSGKVKPRINIKTKDPSCKQIIAFINNNSRAKFIVLSNLHITNLNRALKNIKSNVITDFIREDQYSIIITTNKIMSNLELKTIEKYMKNINMNTNNISTSCLPQSKSYLKIIEIPYLIKSTNIFINSSIIL